MKKTIAIILFSSCVLSSGSQTIYTFAGTGIGGYNGDAIAATSAQLFYPTGLAVDAAGNIYITDHNNHRIRKVNTSGIISTFAGTGVQGFSGDGSAAASAQLAAPFSLAVDASGNVYVADVNNSRIRKINSSGVISTFAGNGTFAFGGDGGLATNSQINGAYGVAVDALGNVYIADAGNNRIRKVNTSGLISTIAGTSTAGYSGDGAAAINAQLNAPRGIAIDVSGNIFIADVGNNCIRKINTSGIISTFAGTGTLGFTGDGGLATAAQLSTPHGIAFDASGNVYIADYGNQKIRKVDPAGIISTFAGTTGGFSGDGGPAVNAQFNIPAGVIVDASGNVFIADANNNRIRQVCLNACGVGITPVSQGEMKEVKIFPNPNNGSFNVQINNEIENGELILLNTLGQKIYEQKISAGENPVKLKNISKGLYHYSIMENKKLFSAGKISIE